MAANKMAAPAIDPAKEDQIYAAEVEAVKKWWTDSRWRHTKRPFTAGQIVAKRGTLKIDYASNAMSKKLWKILESRFEVFLSTPIPPDEMPADHLPYRMAKLATRTDV
jgi:isocitrate lyase